MEIRNEQWGGNEQSLPFCSQWLYCFCIQWRKAIGSTYARELQEMPYLDLEVTAETKIICHILFVCFFSEILFSLLNEFPQSPEVVLISSRQLSNARETFIHRANVSYAKSQPLLLSPWVHLGLLWKWRKESGQSSCCGQSQSFQKAS